MNNLENIKHIVWCKGLDLSTIEAGTMVNGIPLRHLIFKLPLERGLAMCRSDWRNWKRINEELQRGLALPVFYCLKCNQIEEGKFRLLAAKIYGEKKANIMLWGDCRRMLKEEMYALENKIVSGEITP